MRHIFLFILFFSSFVVFSQNSLLWKISSKNLPSPSYIFGSIHSCDSNFIKPSPDLYRLIDTAKNIAVEIDMTNPAHVMKLYKQIQLKKHEKPIKSVLDSSLYSRFTELMSSSFMTKEESSYINALSPLYLLSNIGPMTQMKGAIFNFPMDEFIADYARKKKYKIFELESIEDQIGNNFVDSLPQKMLVDSFTTEIDKYYSTSDSNFKKVIRQYIDQDINEMAREDHSEYLITRNKKISKRIDSLIQKNPLVIIVGASHLAGDDGILALLKKAGYTVKPILTNVASGPEDRQSFIIKFLASIFLEGKAY